MSYNETLFGVTQYEFDLFPCDSGEPLQKIVNSSTPFKVFKQGTHWHAAVLEKPLAAALARDALDSRAIAPVQHDKILSHMIRRGKISS